MKQVPFFFLILLFFLFAKNSYADESFSVANLPIESDSTTTGLNSLEWKKFKKFEAVLHTSELSDNEKEKQLIGYARDSLKILEVKLIAIKVLDEKSLLNRDIAENPSYYSALLEELRESSIPAMEYLFLEEKMAYINQEALVGKLKWSRWMNVGLIAFSLMLLYVIFGRKKRQNTLLPELSKQETLVRNLILQGKSNKEIATELFISLSTVKSHITNIYSKLNVTNRQQLLEIGTGTST